MTDRKQLSPEISRKLKNMFINITGETTITEQQDLEQETSKKVINDADSRPPQGET